MNIELEIKKSTLRIKRGIDFIVILIAIIVLLPIYVIVPILIFLEIKENPFFTQDRIGKNGVAFKIFKFKTMKSDKKAEKQFDFSKDNQRITKVGKFLRRTKIDELPQLINVVLGDMSIVGPRPTIEAQVTQYNEYQKKRLLVKPGMTGLAQVKGNIAISWEKRINYDIEYVENISIVNDLKIIIKTVGIVILGEDKFADK